MEDVSIPYVQGLADLPPVGRKLYFPWRTFCLFWFRTGIPISSVFKFYYPQWANRSQETLPKENMEGLLGGIVS